jgi:hypothetical protein
MPQPITYKRILEIDALLAQNATAPIFPYFSDLIAAGKVTNSELYAYHCDPRAAYYW